MVPRFILLKFHNLFSLSLLFYFYIALLLQQVIKEQPIHFIFFGTKVQNIKKQGTIIWWFEILLTFKKMSIAFFSLPLVNVNTNNNVIVVKQGAQ